MSRTEHVNLSRETEVSCVVFTTSDTRTLENDHSGSLMKDLLELAGHQILAHEVIKDDVETIRAGLRHAADLGAHVILFNGGTGISRRDSTYEAIEPLLDKTLPGFGELFRMLSFEQIGPAGMLSRAIAGVYRHSLVFCTPGSTGAVRLAMERLIVPELRHFVWEILRQPEQRR